MLLDRHVSVCRGKPRDSSGRVKKNPPGNQSLHPVPPGGTITHHSTIPIFQHSTIPPFSLVGFILFGFSATSGQDPELLVIERHSLGNDNRIRLEVRSTEAYYYVLNLSSSPDDLENEVPVSMHLGQPGSTLITEPLGIHPQGSYYRVAQYLRSEPGDIDGDGVDDLTELLEQENGLRAPLNPAFQVGLDDGTNSIPDRETFALLSYQGLDVLIDTHLEDLEFVKFYIVDADTDKPFVLFMNTVTHRAHRRFANAIGLPSRGMGRQVPGQMRGEIVFHPQLASPNGGTGVYRFEFEPNDSYSFEDVQMGHELLARNMPVVENNLAYYPMPNAALPLYWQEKELYDTSRIPILLEGDLFAGVNYIPLNLAEGYGLLRKMNLNDRPTTRDIVIYDTLPNELPRVAGVITTVAQTPLSHVNLRAIQDGVPNAYIPGALEDEVIGDLIGNYVLLQCSRGWVRYPRGNQGGSQCAFRGPPTDWSTSPRSQSIH